MLAPDLVVIAPADLEVVVSSELGPRATEQFERLFLVSGRATPHFAQNIWLKPEIYKFKSISDAAKKLKSVQRNWWLHSTHHHRRAQLIQEQLPSLKPKPIAFLAKVPTSPLGGWTLLNENTLLFSAETSSPYPDGEVVFIENKTESPSRAYLKLWEFFTLSSKRPCPGERVLDLGSSPGGWTWVLQGLGCEVISVDKAPLDPKIGTLPRVEFKAESAFGLEPSKVGKADWLFSDVICYPEKLLELIRKWEPFVPNLMCTIKFQGETDFEIVDQFLEISKSQVKHLSHNKHELTWWRITN